MARLNRAVNEDKSTRFRRRQRRLRVVQAAGVTAALVWTALMPEWARLTSAAVAGVRVIGDAREWTAIALADIVVFTTTAAVVALCAAPAAWAREVLLEAQYGGAVQSSRAWTVRYARRAVLLWACALPVWLLFQHMNRTIPLATVPVVVGTVALAGLVVLVVAPWLVTWSPRVTPLRDEALTGRLHALVSRAGLRVAGLHEWRMEGPSAEPNAALLGVGRGRRLLLSDALIEAYSPEEVEVVVAHELGHHVSGHIWRRLRSAWVALTLAVATAQAVMAGPVPWWAGTPRWDASALPWAALACAAVWLAARPQLLAQSRQHEREADRFSLELTGRADVLERLLVRVASTLRTSPGTTRLDEALFLTHPSAPERIALAREWLVARGDQAAADQRQRAASTTDVARDGSERLVGRAWTRGRPAPAVRSDTRAPRTGRS